MKEPQEYLADPLARARRYIQKFPAPTMAPRIGLTET